MKIDDEKGIFFFYLKKTLQHADEDIADLRLADNGDTLEVIYLSGAIKRINIAMDSKIAVIKDIGKQWDY